MALQCIFFFLTRFRFEFQLGIVGLPTALPDDIASNETAIKALHRMLLEVQVNEGSLRCPKCEREYPITKGVPNMILREDEVAERKKVIKELQKQRAQQEANSANQDSLVAEEDMHEANS